MNADGPSGFRYAPVTKFLVPIVGGCSALAAVYNVNNTPINMAIQLSHLSSDCQFWRLFSSHCAFSGIGTTVVGTWLIYRMKIIERRYGSSKYAALVLISFVASTLLQTGALVIGSQFGWPKFIPSGPYAILFSIFYQFQKIVPPSHQVKMMGITMSDKSYVYIAAIQLLLSNPSSSIVPCLCGWIIGAIYDHSTSIKQWRFPKWTRSLATKYILPILSTNNKNSTVRSTSSSSSGSSYARSGSNSSSSSSGMRQRTTTRASPSPPQPPVSEADIDQLFAMFPNYSRQDIKNALVTSKSDLNRAAEILLTSEPSAGSSQSSTNISQ